MSVMLVVAVFVVFILADYFVGQYRARRGVAVAKMDPAVAPEATVAAALAGAPPVEPVWVAGYQLPEELSYHRGHTWARAIGPDTVLIGLDDFARKLIGPIRALTLPKVGSWLRQGGTGFGVQVNGRGAGLLAPIDGEVLEINPALVSQPSLVSDDPYGRGWVMKLRASDLNRTMQNMLSGSLANKWMEDSRERLQMQLMALSGSVLQDGGEPVADFARHLEDDDWQQLIHELLLT
jgi:glycine cleavage system H protein